MKKCSALVLALALLVISWIGCSSDSSNTPAVSTLSIDSIADDMRQCAPDLSSLAITDWASGDNGWSGHVQYGVLKKHFDAESGNESLYATVLMIDEVLSGIASSLPETVLDDEDGGTITEGGWTVDYAVVNESVTLPDIVGGTVVDDFETHMTLTGTMDGDGGDSAYQAFFYYKPAGDDGIEKISYRYEITGQQERGLLFAIRDTITHDIEVWVASIKGSDTLPAGPAHVDAEHRVCLNFEGNTEAQTFRFKLKTDAADGWAFWGGGSVATDADYIVVRGTDTADSATYANDGSGISDDSADTTYVVLTFGNMKDAAYTGGDYPKAGTAANLNAEADALEAYITFGSATCMHESLAAARDFTYPESPAELGFTL